jgi:hypothetical protein
MKIFLQKYEIREGILQNNKGNIKIPKKVLIQFRDKFITLVEGSKIENKFIIIFKLMNSFCFQKKIFFYLLFYLIY